MRHLTKIFLASLLLMWGCRNRNLFPNAGQVFVQQSNAVGIYVDGRQMLAYDPLEHQTAQRSSSFRIQTDDQSVYLIVQFDPMPSLSAPVTRGKIGTAGVNGVEDGSYDFQVMAERDDKIWLWNDKQKIGLICSLQ